MGETLTLPSTAKVPLRPEMLTEVACVVAHVSVADSPAVIVAGEAVKESITGVVIGGVQPQVPSRYARAVMLNSASTRTNREVELDISTQSDVCSGQP